MATPSTPCRAPSDPGRPDDRPARLRGRAVTLLAALGILYLGSADLALRPEGPVHTDLAGHIVALRAAGERILSTGSMRGWSDQWFAGYPGYHFYFPLPALLTLALAPPLSLEVAAKLIAVSAPLLVLFGATRLARSLGVSPVGVALAQLAMLVFAVDTSHSLYGGNILSSVLGEYAYAMSLGFGLFYLSFLADQARGIRRDSLWPSIALAAAALSHAIPTLAMVSVAALWLLRAPSPRAIVLSWLLAFGLTAFWSLPFVIRADYMGHSNWVFDPSLAEIFPPALVLMLPWAVWGLLAVRWRLAATLPLAALCFFGLAAYLVPHGLFGGGRGLPIWYLGILLFTALGVAELLGRAARDRVPLARVLSLAGVIAMLAAVLLQSSLVKRRSGELYSATAPDQAAHDSLVATLATLPPGQVHWEILHRGGYLLGQIIPLTRIPDLVPGMRSTEGLFVEATHTAPLFRHLREDFSWEISPNPIRESVYEVDRNRDAQAIRFAQLGVAYLVTFSDSAHAFGLRYPELISPLGTGEGWKLWRVAVRPPVEIIRTPLQHVPREEWHHAVAAWLQRDASADRWTIIGDGPRRPASSGGAGGIESLELSENLIRFRTSAVGAPHIVRVSYFPNWRVAGAEGPYLVAPGFMVVVPERPEVELRFAATAVDRLGVGLSLLSALIAVGIAARGRCRGAPASRS